LDPLTQGLLGAALAQSAAKPRETRIAAAVGAVSGLLADLDVLIRSSSDPLLTLEYHRHFTHSLVFVPLGALIAALVLWPFLRSRLAFARLYLFALLGYGLSGVLDACTSYGTQLFWPFSSERVAWNLIAIIDPLFTLALLIAVVVALVKRLPPAAWAGLAFAALYLGAGWVQQQRAEVIVRELAQQRDHDIERVLIKPTLGNLVLWRSIYEAEDAFHVDAVRVGLGSSRVYPGGSAARVVPARVLTALPRDSAVYLDAVRFDAFSDGFTAWHPDLPNLLGDVRYSMSPTSLVPLWGIELDPERPNAHANYRFFRDMTKEQRTGFVDMFLGRDSKQ
jgi:inner membrane protein